MGLRPYTVIIHEGQGSAPAEPTRTPTGETCRYVVLNNKDLLNKKFIT